MLQFDLQVTGLDEAIKRMEELRVRDIPRVVKQIQWSIALKAKEETLRAASGEVVNVRGGQLRRHINLQQPQWQGDEVSWGLPVSNGEAGLLSRIGAFLEKGGEVRPRTAKMLRIPLDAAKTGKGIDRYANVPLRTVPGFFVVKSKAGNLLLMRSEDRNPRNAVPWYVLKMRVYVKAHPWFSTGVARTNKQVSRIIGAHLARLEKEAKA